MFSMRYAAVIYAMLIYFQSALPERHVAAADADALPTFTYLQASS